MKLAVLGGGNTGCCMAAEFTLRGFDVALYDEKSYWSEHIDGILKNGGIVTLTGHDFTGDAKISKITDSLSEAVENAEIIFISLVIWRHQAICEALKPLLKPGQTVIFSAGNFASIRLRGILGPDSPVVVGEMMGNIFPCRMLSDHTAVIAAKLTGKMVSAFPAQDSPKFIENVGRVFPCTQGQNVFETALNAPNVVVHLAGSLLNIASVEKNPKFGLYKEGLTPSVMKCILAVEAEKRTVMEKMGYAMIVHSDHMEKVMQYDKFPELDDFRGLEGPSSRLHRYINEDAYSGDAMLLSLGDRLGIQLPTLRSLIHIASVINDRKYAVEGITMDMLGIPGDTPETINQYLFTAKLDWQSV